MTIGMGSIGMILLALWLIGQEDLISSGGDGLLYCFAVK
jgi:hypothetical protein